MCESSKKVSGEGRGEIAQDLLFVRRSRRERESATLLLLEGDPRQTGSLRALQDGI